MICPNCKAEYREGFFTCSDCKIALVEEIGGTETTREETKMPELVTVAVFGSPYEAGLAKTELEAYGIQAFIADEFTVSANPLYSNALGGVKLKVTASHVNEAKEIISSKSVHEYEDNEIAKPTKTRHRAMAKTFVWIYLLFGAIMTLFVIYVAMNLR